MVVIVAVAYGVVALARSVLGGNGTPTAAAPTTAAGADPGSTSTSAAGTGGTTPVDASTSLPASADPGQPPSAADPARVVLTGDSEAGGFAPYLEKMLKQTGVVDLSVDYKSSTGLARPDYFNWPDRLASQLPIVNPDIVLTLFGGNDAQSLLDVDKTVVQSKVGSDAWKAEYGKRVGAVMDLLSGGGRTLIWIGVPNAESPNLDNLKFVNEVVQDEITKHPKVIFIDSWKLFSGIDGGFAAYAQDPADGQYKPVRAADGFHLNATGATILAETVSAAVITELRKRGASI